jgi:hypothetical protein
MRGVPNVETKGGAVMRRLVQSVAPLLVVIGMTTGAASLAEAAVPTQGEWANCRETDTFQACCRTFAGTYTTEFGGQGCVWGGVTPGGGGKDGSVFNHQPGSAASASGSGDYVGNLPKKKRR